MNSYKLSRIGFVRWFFCLLGALFTVRLFYLQVVRYHWYESVASGKLALAVKGDVPLRGTIFALDGPDEREFVTLATNQKLFLIFAEPRKITEEQRAADALAAVLGLEKDSLLKIFSDKEDHYAPLKHFVSEEIVQSIDNLHLQGIGHAFEMKRVYPTRSLFGTITGFLGYRGDERVGQYGLEEMYEAELSGARFFNENRNGASESVSSSGSGVSVVTSLNRTVQQKACEYLESGMKASESARASIIVLEPSTGYIKALCSLPSYDPNVYNEVDGSLFRNLVVSESYEPGSVFKPITMASAIDAGVVSPSSEFTDTGFVKFGKYIIRNAEDKVYGNVTMTQVLEESINTGVMFAVEQMGMGTFDRYVRAFGFGKKTDVDILNEDPGNVSSLGKRKDIYAATGSFGQGITVTVLQIARGYAAIANRGFLPTPRLGRSYTRDGNGETAFADSKPEQIISSRTAELVSAMLASVVNVGHSKGASVPGYFVAGKTGTAQIANAASSGYSEDTNHTFAGFFPLSRPRFVVVVKMERPQKGKYAESTTVPVFRSMAEFLLQYYKVPPDKVE